MKRDYIWMGRIPIANVDTTNGTSTITYVTADQLGTPRAIADGSGNTIWQRAYQSNPWNEVAPTSNGYVYNLGFSGQYFDAETGQFSNGPRYFDPGTGGFDQPDPLGQRGGIGLYIYVSDDPLSNVDPSGLQQKNELDPKAAEELNTPETNAEVARLDEQAKEEARDDTPALTRDPSEFGEFGTCKATPPNRSRVGPIGGNGGSPDFLTPAEIQRIQNAANRIGKPINLVGSQASGTAGPDSDWDYVIDANAPTRNSVSRSLPGAGNLSDGVRPNLDVFNGQVNPGAPFVTFFLDTQP
jgi:RHS repeat-associated protein